MPSPYTAPAAPGWIARGNEHRHPCLAHAQDQVSHREEEVGWRVVRTFRVLLTHRALRGVEVRLLPPMLPSVVLLRTQDPGQPYPASAKPGRLSSSVGFRPFRPASCHARRCCQACRRGHSNLYLSPASADALTACKALCWAT